MVSSPLLLSTKKEEEASDALLAALSTIAHVQATPKPAKPKRQRRSRFFFKPTISFKDDLDDRKKISLPKEVEIVDEQISKRQKTYKQELPSELSSNIEEIREFWLKNIAPLTLAAQSGSQQAKDVVQRTLDTAIDETPFAQFERMVQIATLHKMSRYIVDYMGLPKSYATQISESLIPQQKKEVMFFPDMHDRRRPQSEPKEKEPTPEKNLKQTE